MFIIQESQLYTLSNPIVTIIFVNRLLYPLANSVYQVMNPRVLYCKPCQLQVSFSCFHFLIFHQAGE